MFYIQHDIVTPRRGPEIEIVDDLTLYVRQNHHSTGVSTEKLIKGHYDDEDTRDSFARHTAEQYDGEAEDADVYERM